MNKKFKNLIITTKVEWESELAKLQRQKGNSRPELLLSLIFLGLSNPSLPNQDKSKTINKVKK